MKQILKDHKLWLETGGNEGTRANLRNVDLGNTDLRNADLRNADLRGANLRYADLRRAHLGNADLRNADLQGADLRGANLQNTRLPSPIMVLMANWGELSDELTAVLMRLDASGHPEGETAFDAWAKGGPCPYDGCQVQRVADFKERKECWGLEVSKMGLYEIMVRVLREKCSV